MSQSQKTSSTSIQPHEEGFATRLKMRLNPVGPAVALAMLALRLGLDRGDDRDAY